MIKDFNYLLRNDERLVDNSNTNDCCYREYSVILFVVL